MLTKCIVIDDEQPAINVLENYIKRVDQLQLVGSATNPVEGIALIKKHNVDVVFLDIQMDEMTGIEVISQLDDSVQVIFCTAYSEFAVKSYDLNAVDYLMKPIGFPRFLKAVKKLKMASPLLPDTSDSGPISEDYIFVKAEAKGKMIRIDLSDIDFIEARSNYVAVHRYGQITMVYATMQYFEDRLSPSHFMRVHKSFIVATGKIKLVEKNYIELKNRSEHIPISKTYRQDFIAKVTGKLIQTR